MSSLTDILNTGRQSLRVQQLAMQVIGQNTANVNTEGYSRRRLDLATAPPYEGLGQWSSGAGVDTEWLGRVRDNALDIQIRGNSSSLGYWTQSDDTLGRVEEVFNELGDNTISNDLQKFWAAWSDLSNNPEGMSGRTAVLQSAQTLASGVRRVYSEVASQWQTTDKKVVDDVNLINTLTAKIAQYNVQITRNEVDGEEASDLRDARDTALDQLSKLVDINVHEDSNGSVNVFNGGQVLVQVDRNVQLTMSQQAANGSYKTLVTYGSSGRAVTLQGGELKSLMDLRDNEVGKVLTDLDSFAVSLANRVNAVHSSGYGLGDTHGFEFFSANTTSAANFGVAAAITDDPSRIASASMPGAPGDNSIALQLAGIQNEKLMRGGQATLDEFYRDSVLTLGSSKSYAAGQLKVEQAAMDNLQNRKQQVSGVSMDEEMAHLVSVQKAYQAAAKVVTTVDQMMQTLLGMGGAA
jgi:flagellar hook-associated protein 1